MRKKLGDLVEPMFERMGAKKEKGNGAVSFTVTIDQLNRFFDEDPIGRAIDAAYEEFTPLTLSELLQKGNG